MVERISSDTFLAYVDDMVVMRKDCPLSQKEINQITEMYRTFYPTQEPSGRFYFYHFRRKETHV
jgi:hypothetical protein